MLSSAACWSGWGGLVASGGPRRFSFTGGRGCAGVVEAARLFFEAAELVFEGFHAVVGREVEVGGARGDVEDGDLRGAAAGLKGIRARCPT